MNLLIKRLGLAVAAMAVAFVPLVAQASFSPDRPTKAYDPTKPGFDQPTFNSYTGTPFYGDERYFLDAKDSANAQNGGFADVSQVKPGEVLTLRAYIHNGADPSLNASGTGIAKNTRIRFELPTGTANSLRATAFVSASNATMVSDTADFQNPNAPFSLSYVPGSAQLFNAHFTNGVTLGDDITQGNGTLIGSDALDGNFKACFEFQSFVYIKVKVNGPSISLTKTVGAPGTSSANTTPAMTAKPGDTVAWLLHFKNTSNVQVNSLTVRDMLPAHIFVVPGSVKLINPNNPSGLALSDNGLFTAGGVQVGDYAPGSDGYITYRTTVSNDLTNSECNPVETNTGFAHAAGVDEIKATATVTITHVCQTPPTQTPPPVTPPTPPTTPPTLPVTGPEGAMAGVFGTTGIGYGLRAYLRSKRGLVDALKR